jgi:hypothetical protein
MAQLCEANNIAFLDRTLAIMQSAAEFNFQAETIMSPKESISQDAAKEIMAAGFELYNCFLTFTRTEAGPDGNLEVARQLLDISINSADKYVIPDIVLKRCYHPYNRSLIESGEQKINDCIQLLKDFIQGEFDESKNEDFVVSIGILLGSLVTRWAFDCHQSPEDVIDWYRNKSPESIQKVLTLGDPQPDYDKRMKELPKIDEKHIPILKNMIADKLFHQTNTMLSETEKFASTNAVLALCKQVDKEALFMLLEMLSENLNTESIKDAILYTFKTNAPEMAALICELIFNDEYYERHHFLIAIKETILCLSELDSKFKTEFKDNLEWAVEDKQRMGETAANEVFTDLLEKIQ